MELKEMTLEQLQLLKSDWLQKAKDFKLYSKIAFIAENLGEIIDHQYTKYRYTEDDFSFWYDAYGHSISLSYKRQVVYNSYFCIWGDFMEKINDIYDKAGKALKAKDEKKREIEKLKLISELTLINE